MDTLNSRVVTAAAVLALAIMLPSAARADEDPLVVSINSARIVEPPQLAWWQDQTAKITHRVSYADLDLSKNSDVVVLKDRIDRAAYLICKRLGEAYPEGSLLGEQEDEDNCVQNAEAGAMEQMRGRIAQAQGR